MKIFSSNVPFCCVSSAFVFELISSVILHWSIVIIVHMPSITLVLATFS